MHQCMFSYFMNLQVCRREWWHVMFDCFHRLLCSCERNGENSYPVSGVDAKRVPSCESWSWFWYKVLAIKGRFCFTSFLLLLSSSLLSSSLSSLSSSSLSLSSPLSSSSFSLSSSLSSSSLSSLSPSSSLSLLSSSSPLSSSLSPSSSLLLYIYI